MMNYKTKIEFSKLSVIKETLLMNHSKGKKTELFFLENRGDQGHETQGGSTVKVRQAVNKSDCSGGACVA